MLGSGSRPLILEVHGGPYAGYQVPLGQGKCSLGRDASCDLQLEDPKVSRFHGAFEIDKDVVHYRDNGSTNGSYLNGTQVHHDRVQAGDLIEVGGFEIYLRYSSDFQTIQFHSKETNVTKSIASADVSADALAQKFAQMFDYYKEHTPQISEAENRDLVHTQRMANSLRSLYKVTTEMSRLLPPDQLLVVVADGLFEVFGGVENLVILLRESEEGELRPRYARDKDGNRDAQVAVSTTVLNQAIEQRATIVANDPQHDSRFQHSESIVGLTVQAVICAPLVGPSGVMGALYLDNRMDLVSYDEMDVEILTAFANQAAIALENARLCEDLQQSYHETLQALVNTIEAKDQYTMGHTQRVKKYALGLARELGLDQSRIERLGLAAELHDIGKIGVSEGVINKPGMLTDLEYEDMKDHVLFGEKILRPIAYLRDILPWVRGHHERWDGKGYPDGLKGEECPLEARILAVADAFDAMTSQRSYNKPLSFEEAVGRVRKGAGTHFDPKLSEAFSRYVNNSTISHDEESVRAE